MKPTDEIIRDFRRKVCDEIAIEQEGLADRYVVYTPFLFDDGDHFVVVLKRSGDGWIITDEGHTFMHLEYSSVDLTVPTRLRIIEDSLAIHGVAEKDGELIADVPDGKFGDALFSFLQALSQVANVTKITREFVQSTFLFEFESLIRDTVPSTRLRESWRAPFDAEGRYEVDFMIESRARPWLIFGINSETKCNDATIACYALERHMEFESLAIFENQEKITRRAVAKLSDVIGKQFASLGDRERIAEYLRKEVIAQNGNGRHP